jgi:hypothetical protein
MKAKEYFSKYNEIKVEKGSDYALVRCFMDMFNEVQEVAKSRNAKSDSAMFSIFDETNKKGNAFIKMVNKEIDETKEGVVNYNGFKIFVQTQFKELSIMIGWN